MKVAVVGVTGMVGQIMLKVLEERNFPITELIPVASEKSIGKKISFKKLLRRDLMSHCFLRGVALLWDLHLNLQKWVQR